MRQHGASGGRLVGSDYHSHYPDCSSIFHCKTQKIINKVKQEGAVLLPPITVFRSFVSEQHNASFVSYCIELLPRESSRPSRDDWLKFCI
ncbi:hypothetical protein OK016_25865 [Vibrio chagasii]|nr:hypothetical protein [Vibrio chagasii]